MKTNTAEHLAPVLRWQIDGSVVTDKGCERDRNEDCILFLPPDDDNRSGKGALALVADGMGGHMAGGLASEMAADIVRRTYFEVAQGPASALAAAFEQANREIYELSNNNKAYRGMGTTCTALVVDDSLAYCAHVGDSRLYLIRGGELRLLTEDHSMVWEMVQAGVLRPEEARHHPNRNVITRALGARPAIDIFTWNEPLPLHPADLFILCSDGLHDLVEDHEMKEFATSQLPASACRGLVDLAKQRGGFDNISVAILRIQA